MASSLFCESTPKRQPDAEVDQADDDCRLDGEHSENRGHDLEFSHGPPPSNSRGRVVTAHALSSRTLPHPTNQDDELRLEVFWRRTSVTSGFTFLEKFNSAIGATLANQPASSPSVVCKSLSSRLGSRHDARRQKRWRQRL